MYPKISIVVPLYNERKIFSLLITMIFPNFRRADTGSDFSVLPKKSFVNNIYSGYLSWNLKL